MIKGINYDVGTEYIPGQPSRPVLRADLVQRDVLAIRDDLHCNAISCYGTDLDRLVETAGIALDSGLAVWLQPRLMEAPADALLDYLTRAAQAAEELRRRPGAEVVLNVGCELTIFADGMMPGRSFQHRISKLSKPTGWPFLPLYNRRLNKFLGRAVPVVRAHFQGQLTYGAALWETVDWTPFDIVGQNYYRSAENTKTYVEGLRGFKQYGKPVVITEFGCGSFVGADQLGAGSHDAIDFTASPHRLKRAHVRDESVQANYVGDLIRLYQEEAMAGAFVFEFIGASYPHSPDPLSDVDMAGYSVVKSLPGERWEPKAAFREIARLYGMSD